MIIKAFVIILSLLTLNACGIGGGQIPSDHYYRLPEVGEVKEIDQQFNVIKINPVTVEGLYHERSILYVEKNTPLEVRRYHYHYWVETPAKLTQKYLTAYVTKTNVAEKIIAASNIEKPDVEIATNIQNFERVINSGDSKVMVTLEFDVIFNQHKNKNFTQKYQKEIPLRSDSMHDTAEAFGEALAQISHALVQGLSKK